MSWADKIRKRQEERLDRKLSLEKEERRAKEAEWRKRKHDETDRFYRLKWEREQQEKASLLRQQEEAERRLNS